MHAFRTPLENGLQSSSFEKQYNKLEMVYHRRITHLVPRFLTHFSVYTSVIIAFSFII